MNKRLKPTNTMKRRKAMMAPLQVGIEDFEGIFQEQVRTLVRNGLLELIAEEVTILCGKIQQPDRGIFRRAGSEPVNIRTTSGKEAILKPRVRALQEDGSEQEIRLNTYEQIRRSKGLFDEVLEGMCYGVSSSGVAKMTETSKGSVANAWKARSNELLTAFRARELDKIDVVAMYIDGIFLGNERCVVVAMVIDVEGYKHLLDFEEGSSESAEVVHGLLGRIAARGLVVGRDRRVLVLRDGSAAIAKAVSEFWPDAIQQECLVHVERVVCGKLSYKHKRGFTELMNVLRGVQGKEAGEEAFENMLEYVKKRNFAAYEALLARRDTILAFHGLNVSATLNITFLSTNHLENVMGNARGTIGRVCRWHDDTNQLARWMGVALLRAQSGFRRVRGWAQMGELVNALARPVAGV
ncbi:transposase [Microcoleus sp. herbarium8]|uniref:transposase n=1 Tax=Microcoleus sp. herbarium8 TaxID=3055436 RepID=UPI002FCE92B8